MVRPSTFAGSFYPENRLEIKKMLVGFFAKTKRVLPENVKVKALIVPHAGWVYSGSTAAWGYRQLQGNKGDWGNQPARNASRSEAGGGKIGKKRQFVLVGPSHRTAFEGICVDTSEMWENPLGKIPCSNSVETHYCASHAEKQNAVGNDAHLHEHSLEVQVPFLQYLFGNDFSILPVLTGVNVEHEGAAKLIGEIGGMREIREKRETIIIVSSDLSHYLPEKIARKKDEKTIQAILNLDEEYFFQEENAACGRDGILILIKMAKKFGWKPQLIHYSNSGETSGDFSSVVGYGAVVFWEENKEGKSGREGRSGKVQLARRAIEYFLKNQKYLVVDEKEIPAEWQARGACFVTLTMESGQTRRSVPTEKGELRGCIGSVEAREPLWQNVIHNAVAAAFSDPRFPPLTREEFEKIEIEVSVLGKMREWTGKGNQGNQGNRGKQLLKFLEKEKPGLMLEMDGQSALFLPQVWDELPDPQAFLGHLCLKVGLPPDAWQDPKCKFWVFGVRKEKEGNCKKEDKKI